MSNDYTLKRARKFVKNKKVIKDYYPKLNFAAPTGWINDPNGVSIYKDELHLFYQHYPYDSVHGKMHWGHAKTTDGYNWKDLEIALAPDQPYDKDGVFSGSAIVKDDKLYLMYTGHVNKNDGEIRQYQNIAISDDGVNFKKYKNNPVIDEIDVPKGSSIIDFRDPKVFKRNRKYYAVIGSKTIDGKGQVLLYESSDLLDWNFKSVILPHQEFLGNMVECPDLIFFDNKDVFLLSAMNYTDKETGEFYPHISWIIEGEVNWNTFVFEVSSFRKMDGGFDFYAPQTTLSSLNPNEYTMIAWQQGWNRTLPTHNRNHKWAGQMTIPRILKEKNGKIKQSPHPKILSNISITHTTESFNTENSYKVKFNEEYVSFKMSPENSIKLTLMNDNNEKIYAKFHGRKQMVTFSRKHTIKIVDSNDQELNEISYPIPLKDELWEVKILIDTSSIQIFINDYYTLTSTFYSEVPLDTLLIEFDDNKDINNLKVGKLIF